jgi:hypothetical protein
MTEEMSFQECGTCSKRIGDDLDKDTKTTHSRECKDYKTLNEANTHPSPAQIVRMVKTLEEGT